MSDTQEAKDALRSRILPEMTLSDASNLLTAPSLLTGLSPAERAVQRFAVSGNAIVTGGAGTLALVAARALLEHGLSGLCLFDMSFHENEAVSKLKTDFPSARILTKSVDVTDSQAVDAAVVQTRRDIGSVTTLLCFAGVVGCAHSVDVRPDEWRRIVDINTTGSWFCAQAVAKQMIDQGTGGSIMFTASISAHRVNFPQPQAAYNTSKGALLALKSSLAAEWARHGIRVNSLSPGYMDTVLNEGAGLAAAREVWAARNPMGRMGTPEEITGAVVLLCSKAGRYINGADIVVDGGGIVF